MNYNSLMVSASFSLSKKFTVNTGYSIIGNDYNNLPIALLFNRDFGQIYVGTDNLLAFVVPSVSEFSGLTFGTCFYLFRKRKLYYEPQKPFPYFRPKKVKRVPLNGRILKERTDFEFPEQR
jgi:hypothetical protein